MSYRIVMILAAAVVWWPAALWSQERPHMDPRLRALSRPEVREALRRGLRGAPVRGAPDPPLGGMIAVDRGGPGGAARVGVLLRLRRPGSLAALRAQGAEIGSVIGDIVTARVALDSVERLAALADVAAMEAAEELVLVHDSSMRAIRADSVRERVGDAWHGSAGQGVIVGIYDTGLDYTHEDFQAAGGAARVLGLWDQTDPGGAGRAPPAPYTYGHYCGPASLDARACPQRDLNGHGTHVAGTAAGDGSAAGDGGTPYRYSGVAPAADLLIVKGGDGSFSSDRIVDGVRWIFDEAQRLGRPAVVNLSLGGRSGPRDGTSLFEEALDQLTGPGRIVIAAAGNDGSNGNTTPQVTRHYRHGMAVAAAGVTQEYVVDVGSYAANPDACDDFAEVEVWFPGADRLDVTVLRPDGSGLSAPYGGSRSQEHGGGRIEISNAVGGPNPNNQDNQAVVLISDCGSTAGSSGPPASGTWRIRVAAEAAGSGRPYHLWITRSSFPARGQDGFDNSHVVTTPGTARELVAVGAFAGRHCWPTSGGEVCYTQREERGDIARFSSGGPTRDGRRKPDIAAPGLAVVSSLSRDGTQVANRTAPGGVHWALEGTSMAAPHVAGAAALLLQHRPGLTPTEIKLILAATAAQDFYTGRSYTGEPPSTPNNQWGYGKLDVAAALGALDVGETVANVTVTPDSDTLPEGAPVELHATALGPAGDTLSLPVFWSSSDPAVAAVDAAGTVTGIAPGDAVITATVRDRTGTASIRVVPPATLVVTAAGVPPPSRVSSARGTRLPLLRLTMRVDGHEAVELRALSFDIDGQDPEARLLLFELPGASDAVGTGDTPIGSLPAPLTGSAAVRARFTFDTLRLAARDSLVLLLVLELGGGAPNGTAFGATFVPGETRSLALRSRREDRLEQPAAVASLPARTTVLDADEAFALSENPVWSDRVIFSFARRPGLAAVYTLDGRRVVDLIPRMHADGRVVWDLRNDAGSGIAPGVYLIIFDIGGVRVREKLIVARPAGGDLP